MAINKKIKGITIQFNGDTTQLGKALGDVESTVINTQSELKKVNKALKDIDPNNAVLLAQKQEILNEAIEASQKKLKGLEDAQSDVEKQFKSGDVGADAYREFQRTVEATRKKLEDLQKEADDTKAAQRDMANNGADYAAEKIGDVGSAAKTNGKKINDLGSDFNSAEQDARNFSSGIDAIQVAFGSIAADGVKALGSALKEYAEDSQTAANNFAAQTGANAEEMTQYSKVIDELYKNSFGESKNDVATAMAQVKQTVGEIDADKLKEMTENAMTLSDTFGFDVSEQLRAVNMLTTQFGILSDEAYNLIVQGAQNGLNKNSDLLDTINEYAVHYKQLGYSADEFFNSLYNGTESGTFSVDKLGDAMKEFGIRSKDTATTTTEGFTLIGLNADEMREKFAAGGDSAKLATQETLNALFELDDQVVQNQAGVDLFGTMWEDLGKEGVQALMDTNGEIDKTEDALQAVKDVKYDDITTEITGLGREFQEEVLEPLIEEFLPDARKGVTWLKDNLPELKLIIKGIGTVAVTAFAVNKVSQFTSSVANLIGTAKTVTSTITGLSTSTGLLGSVFSLLSGPGGLILGAAGLVAGLTYLTVSIATAQKKTYELTDAQKAFHDTLSENVEKQKEMNEENEKLISEKDSEFSYYRELKTELDNIVTPTGKIQEGYKERAKFILNELGDVTDTEIELNGNVIENYKELQTEIDKTLQLKQAEATLNVYDDDYSEAIKNKNTYYKNLKTSESDYIQAVTKLNEKKLAYDKMKAKYLADGDSEESAENKSKREREDYENYKNNIVAPLRNDYITAQNLYLDSLNTITNYERLSTAILSGNVEDTNVALQQIENGYINAEYATDTSLQNNVSNMERHYKELQEAIKNGEPGVTQEMVNAAKAAYLMAKFEANKQMKSGKESLTTQMSNNLSDTTNVLKDEAKALGGDVGQGFIDGFASKFKSIGILTNAWNTSDEPFIGPMQMVEDNIKSYWDIHSPSKRAAKLGGYVMQGFGVGFTDEESNLLGTVNTIGADTVAALKSQLDNLPTVSLDTRYTSAVKSGSIAPALSGSRTFNVNIGEFVNNTDNDIDMLVQKISSKLNNEIYQTERGMGW